MSEHKIYKVQIVAEDETGKEIKFFEMVEYPDLPNEARYAVPESVREREAIMQARARMPHLKNMRAEWSRHI